MFGKIQLVLLAVLTCAGANGSCADRSLPRPADLPSWVPREAVIKRVQGHGDGGLLEVTWDHSSMWWAAPCRTKEAAEIYSIGSEHEMECPLQLDMKMRPMMLGKLDRQKTEEIRSRSGSRACCYNFATIGNR